MVADVMRQAAASSLASIEERGIKAGRERADDQKLKMVSGMTKAA